jgi:hypothetical protein
MWEGTHRDGFLTDTPLYRCNMTFIKALCTIPGVRSIHPQNPPPEDVGALLSAAPASSDERAWASEGSNAWTVTMRRTIGDSEGSTPGLDPTSPLSLPPQEVLDLVDQLRRVGSVRLRRGLRLASRRVIVLL